MKVKKWLYIVLAIAVVAVLALGVVACKDKGDKPDPGTTDEPDKPEQPVEGPETGEYYCDDEGTEYLIALSGGDKVSFDTGDGKKTGTYSVSDKKITLRFSDATIVATYENGELSLTYKNAKLVFLRKITYKVTFDSDGGSAVAATETINGKTVARPAAPTKQGYTFIGWYTEKEHKNAFAFDTCRIYKDMTLYAFWISNDKVGKDEFTVDFDLGYEGKAIETKTTVAGYLPELPVPEARDGYKFEGWFVSDADDADKLTYKYNCERLYEDVTMHALWTTTKSSARLAAPVVSVYADKVSWDEVKNAAYYVVKIDGEIKYNGEETSYACNLENLAKGEHKIEVVAAGEVAANDSEPAVRYYDAKTLYRVSRFSVEEGTVLTFRGTENATKYTLRIKCRSLHDDEYDLGKNTTFDFSNCKMKEGGIEFIVIAEAEGYAPSVSRTFRYYDAEKIAETKVVYSATAPEEFDDQDVTLPNEKTLVGYECVYKLDVPEFAGWAFTGWYTSAADDGEKVTDEKGYGLTEWTNTAEEVTLYARWINVLSFELKDGTDEYFVKAGPQIDLASEVTVPMTYRGKSVSFIADGAFKNCINLEKLYIYDTIKSIGVSTGDGENASGPFAGCTSLGEINVISTGNTDAKYSSVDGVLIADEKEQTGLKSLAFVPASKSGTFTVPDGVQRIPTKIFANSKIEEVVLPLSVEEIAANAFYSCKNLVTVTFAGKDVAASEDGEVRALKISDYAFSFCTSLEEISLPKRTAEFDAEKVFDRCSTLENVYVAEGNDYYVSIDGILCTVDNEAIYCPYGKRDAIEINEKIAKIGEGAFANRTFIASVIIPDTISEIKAGAFKGCSSLASAIFIGSAASLSTEIGAEAFRDLPQLTAITFDELCDVTFIDEFAFADNAGLTVIELPKSIRQIGDYAFKGCVNVTTVVLNAENSASLGNKVFADCSLLTSIRLSAGVTSVTPTTFADCDRLEEIVVNENNAAYVAENGVLYNKAQTELVYCLPKATAITIPETVTTIKANAFENGALESVVIGKNVATIEEYAFNNCLALATLTFEYDRTASLEIGADAFANCAVLAEAKLPATTTKIGANAFKNAGSKASEFVLTFTEEGKTAAISEIGESAFESVKVSNLVVPASVTKIGANAFANSALETVVFETENLEKIEELAFANNAKLTSVTLPTSGLKTIGAKAFYGANSLESLTVPATVTSIEYGAFYGAEKLSSLTFADGDADLVIASAADGENGAFGSAYELTELVLPNRLTAIGDYAFYNATKLAGITFGAQTRILSIGKAAFSLCGKNAAISEGFTLTVPGAIAVIGESAFAQACFTEVVFENGSAALNIGANAFEACKSLTKLTLPSNLATFGDNATLDCSALTEYVGDNLSEVTAGGFKAEKGILYVYENGKVKNFFVPASYAFGDTETFVINSDVTEIGANAFKNSKIKKIDFNNVQTIGEGAFKNSSVEEIDLKSVTEIGNNAFGNCSSLVSVKGASVATIGNAAFYGASKLAEFNASGEDKFVIPATVTAIGNEAFKSTAIESLLIADGQLAVTIGDYAFANVKINSLVIPARVTAIGAYAFDGSIKDKQITVPATEEGAEDETTTLPATLTFTERTLDLTIGNYAFNSSDVKTVSFPEGMTKITGDYLFGNWGGKIESVFIPSTVSEIGGFTFSSLSSLTSLTIADGEVALVIKSVNSADESAYGIGAFRATKLAEINLPKRVAEIGDGAFNEISTLTSVTIADNSVLTKIGAKAFADTKITSISLPATLTSIGEQAFSATALTEITVPDAVTFIGMRAFEKNSALAAVNLGKSEAELFGDQSDSVFGNYDSRNSLAALVNVTADAENKKWYTANGVLFELTENEESGEQEITLAYYPVAKQGETYEIAKNVTKIGRYAFYKSALTTVTFEEGSAIKEIGMNAFYGSKLTAFNVPATMSKIDDSAFSGCSLLTAVTMEQGEGNVLLEIGQYAFSQTGVTEIAIPARVSAIGDSAFYNGKLESVIFAETGSELTVIGNSAFRLNQINSFENFDKLTLLTEIGGNAFNGLTGITSIVLPENVALIGESAFNGTGLNGAIEIPNSVKEIKKEAFRGTAITEVNWASDNETEYTLGEKVFYACTSLTTVTLPEGLTELADGSSDNYGKYGVFAGDTALTEVSLPKSLKRIGSYAFYGTGLNGTLDLRYLSVETIGEYAFSKNAIEEVLMDGSEIREIEAYAFAENAITAFEFPSELETIGYSAFDGSVVFSTTRYNANYREENGMVIENATGKLTYLDKSVVSGRFVFPEGIKEIGDSLLAGCVDVDEIVLPESVTKIGASAFEGCTELTKINFPANLAYIGDRAFVGTQISHVEIGKNVTRIGNEAFKDVTTLTSLTFTAGGYKGLTLGKYAFAGTAIAGALVIPNRVRNESFDVIGIDDYCFSDCAGINGLIIESGTPTGLEDYALSIGQCAFKNCTALITVNVSEIVGVTAYPDEYDSRYRKAFDHQAFRGCTALTSFDYPTSAYNVNVDLDNIRSKNGIIVGNYLFAECTNLTKVILPDTLLTNQKVPKSARGFTTGNNSEEAEKVDKDTIFYTGRSTGRDLFYKCSSLEYVSMGDANAYNTNGTTRTNKRNLFDSCKNTLKAFVLTGEYGAIDWKTVFGSDTKVFISKNVKTIEEMPSAAGYYTDATTKPEGWTDAQWEQMTTGVSLGAFEQIVYPAVSGETNA